MAPAGGEDPDGSGGANTHTEERTGQFGGGTQDLRGQMAEGVRNAQDTQSR